MTARVHPTAIVGAEAELADDVEVGAYCVIEGRVRIGAGTRLRHHVSIAGDTTIGAGNEFYSFSAIGNISQDLRASESSEARLRIGDGNIFRESTTVNLGCHEERLTRIGDNNMFMACAHVAHDCQIANHCVIANSVLLAGHVQIGERSVVGGASALHQFVRIGAYCMIGGCSRVIHDVPPYVLVNGNPSYAHHVNKIGLERAGFSTERIEAATELFRVFFSRKLKRRQVMDKLSELAKQGEDGRLFNDFVCAPAQRPFIRRRPPLAS